MDRLMGELEQSSKDRCNQKQRRHSLEKPLGALSENVRDREQVLLLLLCGGSFNLQMLMNSTFIPNQVPSIHHGSSL